MNLSSSFPELHSVTHLAALLEFTLESYDKLCAEKHPDIRELDRHEAIVDQILLYTGPEIKAFLARSATWVLKPPPFRRLKTIMRYMDLGDDSTSAVIRYVQVYRHKNMDAHRE